MKIPSEASTTWKISHFLIGVFRRLVLSWHVSGVEHVPAKGGAVLACNHPGGLDSFVLGYACPRQVYYMAKRELFNIHPAVTFFLYGIGAFPINRGARDTSALEYSVDLLRQGRIVGMFPEGTRNRGNPLRRGKSGAVRIALDAGVPIVPVAVLGVPHLHKNWYNPFKRTRLSIQFGKPMRFQPGSKEDIQNYTGEVMLAIAGMMPPELRGPYSETVPSPPENTPPLTALQDQQKERPPRRN